MEGPPRYPSPESPNQGSVSPPTPVVYEDEQYRWEYKVIELNTEEKEALDEARLNKLGEEGWELAAAITRNKTAFYYFKRPGEVA